MAGELADLMQAEQGDGQTAQDQYGDLDDVGVGNGLKPSKDCIAAADETEDGEAVGNRQAENGVNGQGACIKNHGQLDNDVADQADDGINEPDLVVESALQEFRHGGNPAFEIIGQKELAIEDQRNSGEPFEAGDGNSNPVGASGHSNKVVG